jgi:hypothetical protein
MGPFVNPLVPYSQHFIFFVTYEWAQQARVFHYIKLERLAKDEHSSLLCPFVSYKENKVLGIQLKTSGNRCLSVPQSLVHIGTYL